MLTNNFFPYIRNKIKILVEIKHVNAVDLLILNRGSHLSLSQIIFCEMMDFFLILSLFFFQGYNYYFNIILS